MAETSKFIGELDDGGLIQAGDQIPVERDEQNYRVRVNTAGTKAASDPLQDVVASVSGTITPGNLAVFADDAGTVADGGPSVHNAALLDSILTTYLVQVVRAGQVYLATVASILAAQLPPGVGGQFDFSDPDNSAFAALI